MQSQTEKTTIFVALHDPSKNRYDVISSSNLTPKKENALKNFLFKENKEDLKHFWTRVGQYKTVRLETAAPVVQRFSADVNISWSLASKSVSKSAAERISAAFGFPIQECSFVEDLSDSIAPLIALGNIIEDFLKPRQAKRQRTEDASPDVSSLPLKK